MRPINRSTFRWLAVGAVLLAIGVPFLAVQGQDDAPDWRVGAVQDLADAGLETGFPDGSFLAEEPLTGYQAAVLIDRLLGQVATRTGCAAPAPAAGGFGDVPGDHWASGSVAQVAALGVDDAFPEGRFDGDTTLTGYQTALLVARALASAEDQVACSEQLGAAAVTSLQAEVVELRAAIAEGSLQGPAGPVGPAGPEGPAGADGAPGPQGAEGPQGPAGIVGPVGPVGPAGPVGAVGPVGNIGPVGPVGPAGADGASGEAGIACWDRDGDGLSGLEEDVNLDGVWDARDCIGPVGAVGPQGEPGPTGPTGPRGLTGAPGPQGLEGPQGEIGPQGATGPVGPQGPQGLRGLTGLTGAQGLQGPPGADGADGAPGEPGLQGDPGEKGDKGDKGDPGEDGECLCDPVVGSDDGLEITLLSTPE